MKIEDGVSSAGRPDNQPSIINEWQTKEINPQEIAEALSGELEPSADPESTHNVLLRYGEEKPQLILKLNPDKRSIMVLQPAQKDEDGQRYRHTLKFYKVDDLQFVKYKNNPGREVVTSISINVRDSGTGLIAANIIISSKSHSLGGSCFVGGL